MKLNTLLTALLLIASTWCWSQRIPEDTLLKRYYQYPKEAITASKTLYERAQSEHNTPLLIKALILKTTFSLEIDQDEYPRLLREVESAILQEKDRPAKSILQSYAAELYCDYYQKNDYKIRQRGLLQGDIPEDINAWSSNIFQQKITALLTASLSAAQELQQTPISRYKEIMTGKTTSDSLRPTLYDFLSHRAIEILSVCQYRFNNSSSLQQDTNLLKPLSSFLALSIPPEPGNVTNHILKFWQDLLRFRNEQPQYPNALLMAELERLNCCLRLANLTDKDTLYQQTLASIRQNYAEIPMVVEVIAREVKQLLSPSTPRPLSYTPDKGKAVKEKALALCEEGLRLYPHYARINQLRQLKEEILAPNLQVSFPRAIYPGEQLPVKINSTNLDRAEIQVFRINLPTAAYLNNQKNENTGQAQTLISRHSYSLKNDLVPHDTIFQINLPQSGLYKLVVKAPGAKNELVNLCICTQLFCLPQNTLNRINFQVCDWKSGAPVSNAKILIYKKKSQKHIITDSVFTNEKGYASYKKPTSDIYAFQAVNDANPNNDIENLYSPYRRDRKASHTTLITDRSIYRPGQTIYFQGISWVSQPDTLYPQRKQKIEVELKDPGYKTITQLQVVTDSFGAFSGSFTLPAQVLNGSFTLNTPNGGVQVQVTEYKRPEFDIVFDTPEQMYYAGDSVHIRGKVKTFSGITLANQKIEYQVSVNRFYSPSQHKLQGFTHTNSQGEFDIYFKIAPEDYAEKYISVLGYQITAQTTDTKGETQESSTYISAFIRPAVPRIILPEKINKSDSIPFIISTAHAGLPLRQQTVAYSISRLVTPTQISEHPFIQDTLIERTVLKGELLVNRQDTLYPDLSGQPSGAYLFCVRNGEQEIKQIFYLYSSDDKKPPIPVYKWFIPEKTTCYPGETARLKFGTSVRDAFVIYEIYSGERLIKKQHVTLSDEILSIDIPYLQEYGNQLHFIIYYVKDKNFIKEATSINRLNRNRNLSIRTTTFRDHLLPGQQEEWQIQILDEQGKPVIAQVLAFMYDRSLDKLTNHTYYFHPDYLTSYFQSTWNMPYFYKEQNNFYMDNFQLPKYKYPEFQFSYLNTFQHFSNYRTPAVCAEEAIFACMDISSMPKQAGLMLTRAKATGNMLITGVPAKETEFRDNFQETAFFYPRLLTDSAGKVNIRFTMPHSLTQWKLNLLAYTQELAHGQLERYITTSKPLMVRPNLPRFFRSGDQAILKVTVSNLSDSLQQGNAGIELFLPGKEEIVLKRTAGFNIPAHSNQTLDFALDIPGNLDLIGCRIYAGNTEFSDGEQHLLPVLPDETLITETLPIFTSKAGSHIFSFSELPENRKDYRLTLELSANPLWYAVLALPSLTTPSQENITSITASFYVNTIAGRIVRANPRIASTIRQWSINKNDPTLLSKLEQNSELKSILLEASPWMLEAQSETEQIQQLGRLFDENRISYLQNEALNKLLSLQNPDGSWSWFKGMYPSRFITLNVLTCMYRCAVTGEYQYGEKEKKMQIKALRYLDEQLKKDFKNKPAKIGYDQILYLYVRSQYRDIPLGDALEAHKYFIALAEKQWPGFSLYEKAVTAIALHQYGMQTEARNILKSLRQYAVITPEMGMYWPNNRNNSYRNSAVQLHTSILEAFRQIEGNTPDINLMKQWLLRQKQVQNWGNAPATVDAIYALLLTGSDQLANDGQLTVRLGNHKLSTPEQGNPLGYLKTSYPAGEIKSSMLKAEITNSKDDPSWGGLYLQYFAKLDKVKKTKGDLTIDKALFKEKMNPQGNRELLPLNGQQLKTGDKIIVRLTLSVNRDMEFLHLKDMRAACFEPVEQLSGNHWKFGSVYYQDVKDAVTNFFFNSLSRGTYVIEYPVWVNQSGTYQDGVATLQSIYAPEFSAHSTAGKITVEE